MLKSVLIKAVKNHEKFSSENKKNNPNAGMGILEVLVAIGLFAILAIGISSFMTNGMKQQRGIQAKGQQREMTAEIRQLITTKQACANSFSGLVPVAADPPAAPTVSIIYNEATPPVARFKIDDLDKTKLLKIEKMRLTNWIPEASDPQQGNVDLIIDFSKTGETGTTKFIAPDIITLRARLNAPGGSITDCFAIGTQSGGFWQASPPAIPPSSLNDIYYSGGNVGVGINLPKAKLDVAGEVKVGNTAVVCDNAHEGQMRYNSTDHVMEFCDGGTAWRRFGISKSYQVRGSLINGPSSQTCPAGYFMTSCRTEIESVDGQSLHIRSRLFLLTDADGNAIGCQTDSSMTDYGGDKYLIVLMCFK